LYALCIFLTICFLSLILHTNFGLPVGAYEKLITIIGLTMAKPATDDLDVYQPRHPK
jgi:hypothetical protein